MAFTLKSWKNKGEVGTATPLNAAALKDIESRVTAYAETLVGAGAIATAALANLAVTGAKIANETITTEKLGAGSVTTAKLGNTSVNTEKLGEASVTVAKIATAVKELHVQLVTPGAHKETFGAAAITFPGSSKLSTVIEITHGLGEEPANVQVTYVAGTSSQNFPYVVEKTSTKIKVQAVNPFSEPTTGQGGTIHWRAMT